MAAFVWGDKEANVSDIFNVSGTFEGFKDILKENKFLVANEDRKDCIRRLMEIDETMADELTEVCGPDSLKCDGESEDKEEQVNALSEVDLETARLQGRYIKMDGRKNSDIFEPVYGYRHGNDGVWVHELVKEENKEKPVTEIRKLVPNEEVLLVVQIFKPFSKLVKKSCKLTLLHEFHVLGSTQLSQLKDAILCPSDLAVAGDFSENPSFPQDVIAKDVFKSGFFYFEGVFYNDMRDPDNSDYSKVILDWAKEPRHGLGPFQSKQMENHTFSDLKLQLGQPYIFIHQCDCEHIVVFADARLLHADDCLDASLYPLMIYKKKSIHRLCRICASRHASWIVTESTLCPEDPCNMCDTCFRWLHYDENNQKLGRFRAYVCCQK